ncbi:unnamed protein product [Psylliodes chrysocephalus]|uniref:AAA+ ATPase domain-containing protein n=1 Tax=Psylliodes chrysocephalus TaxID=3402493 RepID=A0A9P0CZQ0_9CUCU|nr:unnamed protein product [Psylliodes chrysocephala]
MSSTEILFAKKALNKAKTAQTVYEKTKTETRERKRNILYLIHSYLTEQKLFDSAETLQEEAQLNTEYQVCENVDLDIILQEYNSYYFTKFQKYPKIVKKMEEPVSINSSAKLKRKTSPRSKTVQIEDKEASTKNPLENFQFEIKSLTENAKTETSESKEIRETEFVDYVLDSYPSDWKDMADQIKKEFITRGANTFWSDCIGLSNVAEKLKEAVVYPQLYPDLFINVATWKGVLLFGPPGTGKTLLAKALASEGTTFINVTSSTFISKWRGESEKLIKILFQLARNYAPTTIFIDEVDALASANDISNHEASRRFKSELLTQIDGMQNSKSNIFVLGSTNSPWNLDPAILRRFEKRILVPLPDEVSRQQLIQKYLAQPNNIEEKELQHLAKVTDKFSGSDIKALCKEVTMIMIREKIREINVNGSNKTHMNLRTVNFKDVERALEKIRTSVKDSDCTKYLEWNKTYGSW